MRQSFQLKWDILGNKIYVLRGKDMYNEIESIREHLDSIEKISIQQDAEGYKAKQEADRYKSILLSYNAVFIIKTEIWAMVIRSCEKSHHLIFVKT